MASPEIQRKVGQLRHDVDDIYELLDGTNELVTKIADTQQRHGTRLEEIQQALDLTVGRLDLTVGRMDRIEETQRRQYETLNGQYETLSGQYGTLNGQYETLNAKLDDIVALLRGDQTTD